MIVGNWLNKLRVFQAVMLLTCIPEVPGWKMDRNTDYPVWGVIVFSSSSWQTSVQHLKLVYCLFLPHIYN
jgi:hypothetical protein